LTIKPWRISATSSSLALIAFLPLTVAAAADREWPSSHEGFSEAFIARQFDAITPALCLMEYSLEVTNQRSGETNRREAQSLGVMVSPDGLLIGHGHMNLENRTPLNVKVPVGDDTGRKYDATVLEKPFLSLRSTRAWSLLWVSPYW